MEEEYDFVDEDVQASLDRDAYTGLDVPIHHFNEQVASTGQVLHADNLIEFTNESSIEYNQALEFSFVHATFAVL